MGLMGRLKITCKQIADSIRLHFPPEIGFLDGNTICIVGCQNPVGGLGLLIRCLDLATRCYDSCPSIFQERDQS